MAYYPIYRQITGSTAAGILLSQLMYWFSAVHGREFYKTDQEIIDETGLTDNELRNAKNKLRALPFIAINVKGVPPRTRYLVNSEILFREIHEIELVKSTKSISLNPLKLNREIHENITENTTENTTEKINKKEVRSDFENETRNLLEDTPENRMKVWAVVQEWMDTADFDNQWRFLSIGIDGAATADRKAIMSDWVSLADWHIVKNLKIHKSKNWIKNAAQKSNRKPHDTPILSAGRAGKRPMELPADIQRNDELLAEYLFGVENKPASPAGGGYGDGQG